MADHLVTKFWGLCAALSGGASHAGADRPGGRGGFRPRLGRAQPAFATSFPLPRRPPWPRPSLRCRHRRRSASVPSATVAIPTPAPPPTVGPPVATAGAGSVPGGGRRRSRPRLGRTRANSAPTSFRTDSLGTHDGQTAESARSSPARHVPRWAGERTSRLASEGAPGRAEGPSTPSSAGADAARLASPPSSAVGTCAARPRRASFTPSHATAARRRHATPRRLRTVTRHVAARPSRAVSTVTTPQLGPPVSASLPPGGAEGSAAGAGGGVAGATAAALLALVGVCMLRALLPGLLGLGLAPARSALLVSRLERPG